MTIQKTSTNTQTLFILLGLLLAAGARAQSPMPELRWEAKGETWLFTLRFDHAPTIRATDQHVDMGYYYLDCYRETGPTQQADLPIKTPQITHVRRVYYPDQKVLRYVFYLPRGSKLRVERSAPDERTCLVAIAPVTAARLETSKPQPLVAGGTPRKMVIIDPGHGGEPSDPSISAGAQTSKKINGQHYQEKDLTLLIAQQLEQYVKQSPNLDATLTRRSDVYVSLEDRIARANEARGDLFISIHLNATNTRRKTARGFEIFYLANEDRAVNHQLTAMENDEKVQLDKKDSSGETLRELLRMLANERFPQVQAESRNLCNAINEEFIAAGPFRTHNRGVKAEAFRVLLNFTMPAALAECGFLDNDSDARILVQAKYQKQIAALLFNGINRYFAIVDPKFTPHQVKVE